MYRHGETLSRPDAAPYAHCSHLEAGHRQPADSDQLVGGLQRIEDRREPEVEDTVERQDIHTHGHNGIKDGAPATFRNERREVEVS